MDAYDNPDGWSAWIRPESDEGLRQYLQQVARIPHLSEAEQDDLCAHAAAGDKDALQRLIEAHLQLVAFIAKDYAARGLRVSELLEEGNIGLVRAVNRLNEIPAGAAFVDFATVRIRQALEQRLALD